MLDPLADESQNVTLAPRNATGRDSDRLRIAPLLDAQPKGGPTDGNDVEDMGQGQKSVAGLSPL
jgi:hypothetical protein